MIVFPVDQDDAPIFAAAVIAQPDIVLSSDFGTFHTPKAKRYWGKTRHSNRKSVRTVVCLWPSPTKTPEALTLK